MKLCPMPQWCLSILVFVQLYAARCQGASSTDTTLSACNYEPENLYVVNASAPGALFPAGYVECANATGSDQRLCEVCSCREKTVASVAGVTVAWVVCVGAGDATTCASSAGSSREFCGSFDSSGSQDSSSSSVNVGDSSSSTNSEVGIISGSDASAGVVPGSIPAVISSGSSSSTDTNVDVGSSSNFDTISSAVGIFDESSSTTPMESFTVSPEESQSQATNEDSVITNIAGTAEPTQTSAPQENIIRPSGNGSTQQLDTNTGTSSSSDWSSDRLLVVGSVMAGVVVVAAIAVFIAVRNDRARKKKQLRTPSGVFTDDGSSVATPVTSRLDGRYRRHGHGRRYGGGSAMIDSSDNTPLASIVVLDVDDDFQTPSAYASERQYQSGRSRQRNLSTRYVRSESVKAGEGNVKFDDSPPNTPATTPDVQQHFNTSHGPPVSESASPTHDPIFDSCNTQVSFSSSMSSVYDRPPSPRVYGSEDIATGSFRLVSATYSDPMRDSEVSTLPRERYTTNGIAEESEELPNTIVSFDSSMSSLDSTEYELRSTEASEHLHDSSLHSRSALSFAVGSDY
ncbi:unnamed protein product [Phytophthora fragariaefolia]|uniref:Unnamed protein product n=1 Tax=Phytophthora fragariaefolia TaxID=1490495 RepID=A0A9W6TU24_9STRA|nr:unnamed protein product [Phytophthora fragariaefolia]